MKANTFDRLTKGRLGSGYGNPKANILDYDTDAGKLGMAFTLLRLERKGELSKEEKTELKGLFELLKSWTPERRITAATEYDKLVNGAFKYPAKFFS